MDNNNNNQILFVKFGSVNEQVNLLKTVHNIQQIIG